MNERHFKITDPFMFAAEKTGREKSGNNEKIHQTMNLYCFAKRNMFYGHCFNYLLLLIVVIAFG